MEARVGNPALARNLFERGLLRCPGHAALWQARAKLEAEAGDPQRARRSYESGYAAAPVRHAGLEP
eukprot:scaffold65645_cov33-Phaeocystis_antarctica.AAC.1